MSNFTASIFFMGVLLAAASGALGEETRPMTSPPARWGAEGPGGNPSFSKHIVPLFNRQGCSTRDCHGAIQGQNGFRLSLFGYDLKLDHAELTSDTDPEDETKSHPRVTPANPGRSLALLKPLDEIDHEGGQKLVRGSWQFRMLHDWIAAGARFDAESEPSLERLDLIPSEFILSSEEISLQAVAHFSDGSKEDVTALSNFSSKDQGIARVSTAGAVRAAGGFGDTAVVARYGVGIATSVVLTPNPNGLSGFPEFPAANRIDEFVGAKLRKLGIHPSGLSDDAQFLRRAYLDVIGTLPTPDEARSFLGDTSPNKRTRLIDALLEREEHAAYWATIWSDWSGNTQHVLNPDNKVTWLWHDWFADKFRRNVPYDELVRGVIVATSREGRSLEEYKAEVDSVMTRISSRAGACKDSFDDGTYGRRKTLDLFWMKRGGRVEELAIRSADMFLGIQINCAQCHNHPFDRWTQHDFESFTSFFRVMEVRSQDNSGKTPQSHYGDTAIYLGIYRGSWNTGWIKRHPPKILGGEVIGYVPESGDDPRERLWEWMVAPDNPYFARSITNRLWGHYFGTGIVHPIDDFNLANPPSNPALLDWLARDFIEHDFDLRHLHRRILNSRAYQLSHLPNDTNRGDRRSYSHAQLRRMPPDVVLDAISSVTGTTYLFSSAYGSFRVGEDPNKKDFSVRALRPPGGMTLQGNRMKFEQMWVVPEN